MPLPLSRENKIAVMLPGRAFLDRLEEFLLAEFNRQFLSERVRIPQVGIPQVFLCQSLVVLLAQSIRNIETVRCFIIACFFVLVKEAFLDLLEFYLFRE